MNPVTMAVGAAAFLYGIYTFYLRSSNPTKLGKLTAMKDRWGDKGGLAIHVIAYSIVPMVFGLVMLVTGYQGFALF